MFQSWSDRGDDFNVKCFEEEAIRACVGSISARLNVVPMSPRYGYHVVLTWCSGDEDEDKEMLVLMLVTVGLMLLRNKKKQMAWGGDERFPF